MLSVLIAGCTVAGCAHQSHEPPAAAASASDNEPSGAAAALVDEPPGTIACGKAVQAVREATLMNPDVITDIANAAGTADAPVADAAQDLSAAYSKAVAAHDTDAEPDAVAAVSAAAAELVKICDDSGLETAG